MGRKENGIPPARQAQVHVGPGQGKVTRAGQSCAKQTARDATCPKGRGRAEGLGPPLGWEGHAQTQAFLYSSKSSEALTPSGRLVGLQSGEVSHSAEDTWTVVTGSSATRHIVDTHREAKQLWTVPTPP